MTTTKKAKFKCPDCVKVYNDAAHLGIHRAAAHGIPGTSVNAVKRRRKAAAQQQTQLEAPRQKRRYTKRSELATTTPAIYISNGHHPKAQRQGFTDDIPDALIAVTSGRFIELCRSVAHEFDLPPRMFAARVAAFIYGTTVR